MGGPEAVEKQHAQNKLSVRERLALLFDSGSFVELGLLAEASILEAHPISAPSASSAQLSSTKSVSDKSTAAKSPTARSTPADGVVTGWGLVDGRKVAVIAYDFTVVAGTIGEVGERKAARIRELVLHQKIPLVWLLDSAGARVQEIASSRFAETGRLFFDQVMLSGVVPQVAAMMGPCAAGTAYIAGLADFVPMVKGTSSMALAGPPLVEAAIGEKISVEDLGGSRVHCQLSGVGDGEYADDKECLKAVKNYLSFFPSHCSEKPPCKKNTESHRIEDRLSRVLTGSLEDDDRLDASVLDLLPSDSRQHYDMKTLIAAVVDEGIYFEIKSGFGKGMITALARVGGQSVGIVANQPSYLSGVINIDEADKAARFINLCDAFNIPLIFLEDCPGFMVGSQVEKAGIIRHGAKMLYAVSRASVPKITIIVRKAYGAGYYVMCGKAYGPDMIVAWPSAEISLMGAEGAVNILFRKEIDQSDDPVARRQELVNIYRERISLDMAIKGAYIDDVIDPLDTRKIILQTLCLTESKQVSIPTKKHGISPV